MFERVDFEFLTSKRMGKKKLKVEVMRKERMKEKKGKGDDMY